MADTTLVTAGMVAVVLSFLGLAITDRKGNRTTQVGPRVFARTVWVFIAVGGWAYVAYLALTSPHGLMDPWMWTQAQSTLMQVAMWLFYLPWMGALWISQTGWAPWLRTATIVGLALLSIAASVRGRPASD